MRLDAMLWVIVAPPSPADAVEAPPGEAVGFGWAPATCGEVLQGHLADGRHIVVSLPIALGAGAEATLRFGTPSSPRRGEIALAGGGPKAATAASRTLAVLGRDLRSGDGADLRLRIDDDLPVGRGLGTSTADIVAIIRAVAGAMGATLAGTEIHRLACSIEASDGVAFDGLAAVDRDAAAPIALWPTPPQLRVLAAVPSTRFETRSGGENAVGAPVDDLFEALGAAVAAGSARGIAAVATESGRRHRGTAPSEVFEALLLLADDLGALGVARAHTGTAAGLLFSMDEPGRAAMAAALDALSSAPPAGMAPLRLLTTSTPVPTSAVDTERCTP